MTDVLVTTEQSLEQAALWIKSYGESKIICENTGGLETKMISIFGKYGLKAHAVNPNRISAYRIASAQNAKTDLRDAALIASFAEKMDIVEKITLSEAEEKLKLLAVRRRQIVEIQVQEKNCLRPFKFFSKIFGNDETLFSFNIVLIQKLMGGER